MISYRQSFESYFSDLDFSGLEKDLSLFIFRKDGILAYEKLAKGHKFDKSVLSSIGVLMSGVWQASQALVELVPNKDVNIQEFRFSFDTSELGIYLLPMSIKGIGDIFLGSIYVDQINPGLIKSRLRSLAFKMMEDLKIEVQKSEKKEDSVDSALFSNITDKEIDDLFVGARV